MQLESKILTGLERLSEALKSLLWEKAKRHGISPIQIQILLFVSNHQLDKCNVSYLAKEFNITKATISDAVKVLILKEYLIKDFSPTDNRRYNLFLSKKGKILATNLSDYATPLLENLSSFEEKDLIGIYSTISKLIFQLNQHGIIQVQRSCYNCHFYKGDRKNKHFCNFLDTKLKGQEIKLDCPDFQSI